MKENQFKLGVPSDDGQVSFAFRQGGARKGAGRKAIGVTRKLSLTLPAKVWDELEAACAVLQCSRSEAIREIMEAYFHHQREA
ncbi:hypothetical protein J31TS4_19480 [Paenibacillus sp. J31TS4]|uniref:ribbon-helix-helix protein, CopG family n=1 Tax=Paenibacillus sp. J31TS4 TaxID=2807195 RepID=UPI001B2A1C38|nr:ribbon-helix-helix protein, CopG family [Paenibacillus sp. J31TS4]GIP38668.1 hypothetical protein J31TS4_19480 [Paenibacillus sp. J31TS4]